MRRWTNLTDLANAILARAERGSHVTLSPDTAHLVAIKLMTADAKPTHRDIVAAICDSKCDHPCYPCAGKANVICRAYGQGIAKSNGNVSETNQ